MSVDLPLATERALGPAEHHQFLELANRLYPTPDPSVAGLIEAWHNNATFVKWTESAWLEWPEAIRNLGDLTSAALSYAIEALAFLEQGKPKRGAVAELCLKIMDVIIRDTDVMPDV